MDLRGRVCDVEEEKLRAEDCPSKKGNKKDGLSEKPKERGEEWVKCCEEVWQNAD